VRFRERSFLRISSNRSAPAFRERDEILDVESPTEEHGPLDTGLVDGRLDAR
jgi:hypothetical protein